MASGTTVYIVYVHVSVPRDTLRQHAKCFSAHLRTAQAMTIKFTYTIVFVSVYLHCKWTELKTNSIFLLMNEGQPHSW